MTAGTFAWIVCGAVAGLAQAVALSCAAHRRRGSPLVTIARPLAVGLVLVAAALASHLPAAAAGWICAFVSSGAIIATARTP